MQNFNSRFNQHCGRRGGFTLIEALIAVTMTLIIMLALAQGFRRLSDDISKGRARLSLSDQLRGVSEILRNDLSGLTVDADPTSPTSKSGYFLYYEGPLADHHPLTIDINNRRTFADSTIEQNLSTSKYGDFDDILMFTARSQGDWFRGRVPLAIVKGASDPNYAAFLNSLSPAAQLAEWTNTVVVASEYAEIAYFMMPGIVPTPNGAPTPYDEYVANPNLSLRIDDRDTPVNPAALPAYFPNTGGNAIPDRFTLCRRVLLILPDLNLPTGALFSGGNVAPSVRMLANRVDTPAGSRLMLANAYQRCDLSVHRVASATNGPAPIAANSLEDLANPINRFAHITLPGPVVGLANDDRSMPILSLTGPIPIQQFAVGSSIAFMNLSNGNPLANRLDGTYPEVGFMRPEFLKRSFETSTGGVVTVDDPQTGNLVEVLSNEEVLATNCVAFDLKGYDPVVRLLYNKGADATGNASINGADGAGIAGTIDATGLPGADSWFELGAAGSDDLIVSPSDPGYRDSVLYATTVNSAPTTIDVVTASQGAFVDLGWGSKVPLVPSAALGAVFDTPLSGVDGILPAAALRKSGRVLLASLGNPPVLPSGLPIAPPIYQPCFDSFTATFEHDGFRQRDRMTTNAANSINPVFAGTHIVNGNQWLSGTPNPGLALADIASNGLDDDSNGLVDDYAEQDTGPPVLSSMPTIQALIRMEDAPAGVIQQITVTQDLVTQ